jgi:hypothetical protein
MAPYPGERSHPRPDGDSGWSQSMLFVARPRNLPVVMAATIPWYGKFNGARSTSRNGVGSQWHPLGCQAERTSLTRKDASTTSLNAFPEASVRPISVVQLLLLPNESQQATCMIAHAVDEQRCGSMDRRSKAENLVPLRNNPECRVLRSVGQGRF